MIQSIKILIVEDDLIIGENLKMELEDLGYSVTGVYTNDKDAVKSFKENEPDLLFMDVHLEDSDLDGIEIAEQLNIINTKPIIYLTSFTDKKTVKRAQQTNPAYFLIKPSNKSQKRIAIEFAISNFTSNTPAKTETITDTNIETPGNLFRSNNFFFVKHANQFVRVDIDDVLWVKADGGAVTIITSESKILTHANLSSFARQIEHPDLVRIHRSFVVNKNKVTAFSGGFVTILYDGAEERITIGPKYRETLHAHFPMLRAD